MTDDSVDVPVPGYKPQVPDYLPPPEKPEPYRSETGTTVNSMSRLSDATASLLKDRGQTVTAAQLAAPQSRSKNIANPVPYGHGHDMTALGQGQQYGSSN